MRPRGDELVLPKTSSSVFISTTLDYILRNLGTRRLLVAGCVTDQCVEHAIRWVRPAISVTRAQAPCRALRAQGFRLESESTAHAREGHVRGPDMPRSIRSVGFNLHSCLIVLNYRSPVRSGWLPPVELHQRGSLSAGDWDPCSLDVRPPVQGRMRPRVPGHASHGLLRHVQPGAA